MGDKRKYPHIREILRKKYRRFKIGPRSQKEYIKIRCFPFFSGESPSCSKLKNLPATNLQHRKERTVQAKHTDLKKGVGRYGETVGRQASSQGECHRLVLETEKKANEEEQSICNGEADQRWGNTVLWFSQCRVGAGFVGKAEPVQKMSPFP